MSRKKQTLQLTSHFVILTPDLNKQHIAMTPEIVGRETVEAEQDQRIEKLEALRQKALDRVREELPTARMAFWLWHREGEIPHELGIDPPLIIDPSNSLRLSGEDTY